MEGVGASYVDGGGEQKRAAKQEGRRLEGKPSGTESGISRGVGAEKIRFRNETNF